MDNTILKELSRIFPMVDDVTLQNNLNQAKRLSSHSFGDILTLSIDLVLSDVRDRPSSETKQQFYTPNDDIIYVGSSKANTGKPITVLGDESVYSINSKKDVYIVDQDRSNTTMGRHTPISTKMKAGTPVSPVHHTPQMPNSPASILQQIINIFPTANHDTLDQLIGDGYDSSTIVNHLLEHPELCKPSHTTTTTPTATTPPSKPSVDYYKNFSSHVTTEYQMQCLSVLKNEFQEIFVSDIRTAMRKFNNHYAATRKFIEECLHASGLSNSCENKAPFSINAASSRYTHHSKPVFSLNFLAQQRKLVTLPSKINTDLTLELEFVKQQKKLEEESKNRMFAQQINEKQYEEEGQLIECGCCFGEFPFEEVVQCTDAHLFCLGCLRSYAKEVIFGSAISKAELVCMTSGCSKSFPYSQLAKVLSEEEISKYQDRLQEECLVKVDLPDLVKCPFCEFKAIVPEHEKVFTCMKISCGKMSCKDCGEEWGDHIGLKCREVEKKCQTNLRVSYEEKMTLAKIRICAKCSCQFTKSEGCNKMTCRCGQTMCYICRKPCIGYEHFCRHPRDPGQKCKTCTACSLWTKASEDDAMVVKELEKEAKTAKRKLDDELTLSDKRKKL